MALAVPRPKPYNRGPIPDRAGFPRGHGHVVRGVRHALAQSAPGRRPSRRAAAVGALLPPPDRAGAPPTPRRGAARRAADEEDVALSAFDAFCRDAERGRFPGLLDRDSLWHLLVTLTARKAAHRLRD